MKKGYEKTVKRVSTLLTFIPEKDAVEKLKEEGYTSQEIFLVLKGASLFTKWFEDEEE